MALLLSTVSVNAAKLPQEVVDYIEKTVPKTDIRFDGVVILPDNTIYLPLFPSLFSDVDKISVKQSFPEHKELNQKPDVIIFNNDFVLLKVLSDNEGHKTVCHLQNPPLQVRTGLLPQDMLVPSGLILPENIKSIIGNLKIDTKNEDIIKNTEKESYEELIDVVPIKNQTMIPQLNNKILFATTNYSKNIQVLNPASQKPLYSLTQKSIPVDIKAVHNGKFVLVTSYERPFIDVISVADSRFIKQINLSTMPDKMMLDEVNDLMYVTSPSASLIYVIDLKTMSLVKRIRINGYCENMILTDNKILYVDKLKNDIWSIEFDNEYTLKNLGNYPNISALQYIDGKVYLVSRTKGRMAVVDYETCELTAEFPIGNKPVAMQKYNNYLYVLCAQNNEIIKIDKETFQISEVIKLSEDGFSSEFNRIESTQFAVVIDVKLNQYSIFDLASGKILKTYSVNVPVNNIVITDKVELFK